MAAAALALTAMWVAAPMASAEDLWGSDDWSFERDWNDYSISGLPEAVTAPMPFTVTVDGPVPVCRMTYGRQVRTAAPWTFTFDPFRYETGVDIRTCESTQDDDYVSIRSRVPFRFSGTLRAEGVAQALTVGNDTEEIATATLLTNGGGVFDEVAIEPGTEATLRAPRTGIKRTTMFTLTAKTASGVTMSVPVTIGRGWSTLGYGDDSIPFAPCASLTWAYRPKGQPGNAKLIAKDIEGALTRVAARTGLRFVRDDAAPAPDLVYQWDRLGRGGPSGTGGYHSDGSVAAGTITFNSQDDWPLDRYRGFGIGSRGFAQRGWLVIHETLHALGLGHVNERESVMYPVNHGQRSFTKGDREGMEALYRNRPCPTA